MAKTLKTPYTSVSDVDAFFNRIENIGEPKPPKKVDTAWVQNFGFETAHPSAIPTMLRWLGIINEELESTGVWNELRVDAKRKPTLERLVKEAYKGIFDVIDVSKASARDLRGAFVSAYSIGDPRRQINCFLALCRQAGIETAEQASTREPKTANGAKPAKPKVSSASGKAAAPKPPRKDAPSGVTVTLNVEIPAEWTEEQIRERLAIVNRAAEQNDS